MSALQALFLLPAALILDLLFSEPPARVHPVCGMGYLASRAEPFFRRLLSCPFPPDTEGGSPLREGLAGLLAGLAVILPPAVIAWSLTALAGYSGTAGGFAMAAVSVWLCLAPVSLARHALRVRDAAEAGKTGEARKAVSMIVGRDTSLLDMHGVCRACVESVAENLTDGVLCTLFWAMAGGLIAGFPGAAALAMAERATSTLDALWGRRDRRYRHFGTFGARLDDVFTYLPARLALPAISLAAFSVKAAPAAVFRTGWRFRHAHESPNSAWSEAPFAAALGLRLGGPAVYAGMKRDHPWLGTGTPDAASGHISLAIRLMWATVIIFTLASSLVLAAFS